MRSRLCDVRDALNGKDHDEELAWMMAAELEIAASSCLYHPHEPHIAALPHSEGLISGGGMQCH